MDLLRLDPPRNLPGMKGASRRWSGRASDQERWTRGIRIARRKVYLLFKGSWRLGDLEGSHRGWGGNTGTRSRIARPLGAVTDEGIYLLDPSTMDPVIEFFNFAMRRTRQIAKLPREVVPREGFPVSAIAVSPDSRSILYVQADRIESEIMLVEKSR